MVNGKWWWRWWWCGKRFGKSQDLSPFFTTGRAPRSHVDTGLSRTRYKKHAAKSRRSCRPPESPPALYYEALPASRGRPYAPQRWVWRWHGPKPPHQRPPASRTAVSASPAGQRRGSSREEERGESYSNPRYNPPATPSQFSGLAKPLATVFRRHYPYDKGVGLPYLRCSPLRLTSSSRAVVESKWDVMGLGAQRGWWWQSF